jgi:hypothetical protein
MTIKAPRLACALAATFIFAALPAPVSATLLSTLISGSGTIDVGNLVFGGFNYSNTGDMPSDAGVTVTPYVAGSGDVGLQFTGAFLSFVGDGGSDAFIGFSVTETDVTKLISGATLAGNPTVIGGTGVASVTETFIPTDTNLSLNIFAVSPGSSHLSDTGTFAVGHTQVIVQKDVLAFSATVGGGVPMLSFITQTFHEVNNNIPEPGTIVLLGMGMLTLALAYRRRK